MPHLHLETTPGLVENDRREAILQRLVARIGTMPTVAAAAVKGYATILDPVVIGAGGRAGFAHLNVAILEGRGPDLVSTIADGLYEELKSCFRESLTGGLVALTLELREMPKSKYRR